MASPTSLKAAFGAARLAPPELELLRLLAVPLAWDRSAEVRAALENPSFDWERFLLLASWHGMEPLAYFHLLDSALIPASPRAELRRASEQVQARNMALLAALAKVSRELRGEGIEFLVYKGPLLAQELYENIALRASRDIDLVVRAADAARALGLLQKMGFLDRDGLAEKQLSAALRFGAEHSLIRAEGLEVDLHWRMVPEYVSSSFTAERAFQNCREISAGGEKYCVPGYEELLAALALHAGEHGWAQLSMFADIAQLLTKHDMDWERVDTLLCEEFSRRTVLVSLGLAQRYLGARVGEKISKLIAADRMVEEIADEVVMRFWTMPETAVPKQSGLAWLRRRCQGLSLMARAQYIAAVLLTPTLADFKAFRLPGAFHFLYPSMRALRMIFKRKSWLDE